MVNDSYISFQWIAPFSLDITHIDPDIQFYIFSETLTGSTMNVTQPVEYIFPNLAISIEFSVSAWNILGEGEKASAIHQPCSISQGNSLLSIGYSSWYRQMF